MRSYMFRRMIQCFLRLQDYKILILNVLYRFLSRFILCCETRLKATKNGIIKRLLSIIRSRETFVFII